jgi:hypothetical protein
LQKNAIPFSKKNNFFTTKAKKSQKGHDKQPLCAFIAFVVTISTLWSNKVFRNYTVAGNAIGFTLEQPLHVVAFAC